MRETTCAAIIFAGGEGRRMGTALPKQYLEIDGIPILIHTLRLFQDHPEVARIYLAVHEDYIDYTKELTERFGITKTVDVVAGGHVAQESIYNALIRAAADCADDSIVLLHDGVRPFITPEVISRNIEGVRRNGNAITSIPCYETILVSDDGEQVERVPLRRETFTGQAPQSFRLGDILAAHDRIRQTPGGYTNMVDACTILQSLGIPTHMVEGNRGNIKVTTPVDVYLLRALLEYRRESGEAQEPTAADLKSVEKREGS